MSFLINPYAFLAAGGDFESIATVTAGGGGMANATFTSIPSTFQHLQVRGLVRGTHTTTSLNVSLRINSDSSSVYTQHSLYGDGASALAFGTTSQSRASFGWMPGANASASIFGAFVIDILDYASPSKTRVTRSIAGEDRNGSGLVAVSSNMWGEYTSPVTTVTILPFSFSFAEYSTISLYGLKAPA